MSCFLLSYDHIGFLLNLGVQLDLRGVTVNDSYQSLALDDDYDRRYVTTELIVANRASFAARYNDDLVPVTDVPTINKTKIDLSTLTHVAQALQWVRCYQYQSCDDEHWETTFAYFYTHRLKSELVSKMIGFFQTAWVYEGPLLVTGSCPHDTNASSSTVASPSVRGSDSASDLRDPRRGVLRCAT